MQHVVVKIFAELIASSRIFCAIEMEDVVGMFEGYAISKRAVLIIEKKEYIHVDHHHMLNYSSS